MFDSFTNGRFLGTVVVLLALVVAFAAGRILMQNNPGYASAQPKAYMMSKPAGGDVDTLSARTVQQLQDIQPAAGDAAPAKESLAKDNIVVIP